MTGRWLTAGWLVVVWIALWDRLTVADALAAVVVTAALLALFPPGLRRDAGGVGRVRPVALARYVAFFAWQVVRANLRVAKVVLGPSGRVDEGIVEVPLAGASGVLLNVIVNNVSLTPGTLVLEVRRSPPVVYLHVLQLGDPERVRRDVRRLERLLLRAFGRSSAAAVHPAVEGQR